MQNNIGLLCKIRGTKREGSKGGSPKGCIRRFPLFGDQNRRDQQCGHRKCGNHIQIILFYVVDSIVF